MKEVWVENELEKCKANTEEMGVKLINKTDEVRKLEQEKEQLEWIQDTMIRKLKEYSKKLDK